jgi:hypothetical protein
MTLIPTTTSKSTSEPIQHSVEIFFDPRFTARNYGTRCTCGWRGAFLDKVTAEKSKEIHLARYGKQNGLLASMDGDVAL